MPVGPLNWPLPTHIHNYNQIPWWFQMNWASYKWGSKTETLEIFSIMMYFTWSSQHQFSCYPWSRWCYEQQQPQNHFKGDIMVCSIHFLNIQGPFSQQNGRSLYMIIFHLNDSLCFKEVTMGNSCGKISTFECKVLYIFLKRSNLLKVKPLSLPQTVIWNIVKSMFDFHHTWQFGEHHVAGLAKRWPCAPVSPPPQRTTVPSGGMLNQHVDFSLTCVWTHELYWEYFLTYPFVPESVSAVLDFITLSNPLVTVSSTATHWLMELMRTSDTAVIACQIISGLIQAAHWGRFLRVSGHALENCGICAWSSHSATVLIHRRNCEGPEFPTKVGASSR